MQRKITDFMGSTDAEMDTDLNVRDSVGHSDVNVEDSVGQTDDNVFSSGERETEGEVVADVMVDSSAGKRSREDSPSGLSPICKRTFSLDGKEVSFEHDPWYVGWLFQSLDSMRSEFQFTADMLSSIESFKVETNSRIATLEAEKADDKRVIEELKSELLETKEAQSKAEEKIQVLGDALKNHREYTNDHFDQFAKQIEDLRNVFKEHRQVIDESSLSGSRGGLSSA